MPTYTIWKDIIIEKSTNVPETFLVTNDLLGQIYHGRAVPVPGVNKIRIRLNDLIAGIGFQELPLTLLSASPLANGGEDISAGLYRYTEVLDSNNVKLWGDSVWMMDWTYDDSIGSTSDRWRVLTYPISPWIDARMPIICTKNNNAQTSVNGVTVTGSTPGHCTNFMAIVPSGADTVSIEGTSTRTVIRCEKPRYAIYYVNAMGGWDYVVCTLGKETDGYARTSVKRDYDNGKPEARGTFVYRNDVTRRWELHLGLLDDAGAANLNHLLGSTMVYLYDMDAATMAGGVLSAPGTFIPVNITNSDCVYDTYAARGNAPITDVVVNVELAREIVRR